MGQSQPLCLFSFFPHYNFNNSNWKKCRWCAWDSNPQPHDGRHRRYHGAMAAAREEDWCSTLAPGLKPETYVGLITIESKYFSYRGCSCPTTSQQQRVHEYSTKCSKIITLWDKLWHFNVSVTGMPSSGNHRCLPKRKQINNSLCLFGRYCIKSDWFSVYISYC